ncbi:MAG: putative Na+/H+ antiporter [Moraxellaceae bacterium]|nr:putative Na+/H+ antiporter [Moraxellaceae bacterium]
MSQVEILATALFALAVVHTFMASRFEHLAHHSKSHGGLWHLLGEIEAVFGIWACVLILFMLPMLGGGETLAYLQGLNFTEPMFVFAVMVIAATKPILQLATLGVRGLASVLPLPRSLAIVVVSISVVPLMGSLITEPAAMTLAALILRDALFSQGASTRLKYATLGVLFVNVSIGGTLTSYAAPPVLMVAGTWGWDSAFMLQTFGWKAALAVLVNTVLLTLLFRRELLGLKAVTQEIRRVPYVVMLIHVLFLAGVVVCGHYPVAFIPLLLLFLGFADAYKQFQDRLLLREGLMVALFLAGLVILGGLQRWWLQPLLADMDERLLFFGAVGLTAITDNAALTYLGSLVEGVSDGFKYALVAGAVAGGGLTVIANAPNPAGFALLKNYFDDAAISPLKLFLAALAPTAVAILFFLAF